jgi:hypothetical protein
MVKRLINTLSLCLWLTASLGILSVPAVLANTTTQGSIIQRINVTGTKDTSFLLISGTLDSRLLAGIVIGQRQGDRLTITIPNALVDPETIVSPRIPVPSGGLLKSIQWQESMQSHDGAAQVALDLVLEGQGELDAEVVQPITSTTLRIRLINLAAIKQQQAQAEAQAEVQSKAQSEAQKAEARRKELEAEAARLAKAEQEKAKAERQQALLTARQPVDEVLQQYHRPSIMQLSIINASNLTKRAYELSVYLGKEKRQDIEELLGIKLDIVNISNAKNDMHEQSTIYFRPNFLKAALFLATIIPGEQRLIPIDSTRERLGVDIEVYLGMDFK